MAPGTQTLQDYAGDLPSPLCAVGHLRPAEHRSRRAALRAAKDTAARALDAHLADAAAGARQRDPRRVVLPPLRARRPDPRSAQARGAALAAGGLADLRRAHVRAHVAGEHARHGAAQELLLQPGGLVPAVGGGGLREGDGARGGGAREGRPVEGEGVRERS